MDEPFLINKLSHKTAKKVINDLALAIADDLSCVPLLFQLTFHEDKLIAFKAAWTLEHVGLINKNAFLSVSDEFFFRFADQKNLSCKRHFAKIALQIFDEKNKKTYADILQKLDYENITEACFDWLIDKKSPIAVKVACLDLLYYLSAKQDWIAEELHAQIDLLLKDGSPGIQHKGRLIKKQLLKAKM